jgi:glycosyltransferase involved in cell wall biosynthesis
VIFLDPVKPTETVQSLADFDIGVVPVQPASISYQLCSPNKFFDYLMAGLPVACADLPELKRIVLEEGVGALFNPYDPEDIARCINSMASDHQRLSHMRKNALACSREKYNWEAQSKKLIQAIDKVYESKITMADYQ